MKKKIVLAVAITVVLVVAMAVPAMASTTTPVITLPTLDLTEIFEAITTWVGGQIVMLIPLGIGLTILLASPRIVRRIIGAFGI
jgi:hypothetical protein